MNEGQTNRTRAAPPAASCEHAPRAAATPSRASCSFRFMIS